MTGKPPPRGERAPERSLLDVTVAVARVTAGVSRLGIERLAPADARGQVLASPVRSTVALPPWNNAGMDGYAVRAADVAAVPTRLTVLETVAAGAFPTHALSPGHATRIMTGAPVPDGADSVIRVEDSDGGREIVEIRDNRDAGKNTSGLVEDAARDAAGHLGACRRCQHEQESDRDRCYSEGHSVCSAPQRTRV